MKHLADLQGAGLTHVHLLPSYDYGSVPEREADQQTPEVWAIAIPCSGAMQPHSVAC